jgi:hypothetical protein
VSETEEGYDQAVWERVKDVPRRYTPARNPEDNGTRIVLDVTAFRRLVKKYGGPDGTIDARPKDDA